ncbi:ubiquitin-binding SDF ubiquitin ligase complex subunit met30 [Kluyveromyces marxianus]|nr:ubiquitin-binding SDF ubiquitin ligase complex subunit met30 [Kluyveromyces marxianus]
MSNTEFDLHQSCKPVLKRGFDEVDAATLVNEGNGNKNKKSTALVRNKALKSTAELEDDNKSSHNGHNKKEQEHEHEEDGEENVILSNKMPEFNFIKYCYRHNPDVQHSCKDSMVFQDQLRLERWNQKINALEKDSDRDKIRQTLQNFQNSNEKIRKLMLEGILQLCCFPQLSYIADEVKQLIKIDFISTLPEELSLKILGYLDCQSLCTAALVCKRWKVLADDDRVWYHMCEQHIDRKCPNCGWGLPLLHMKRARFLPVNEAHVYNQNGTQNNATSNNNTRESTPGATAAIVPSTRSACSSVPQTAVEKTRAKNSRYYTRPWKVIYRERFQVESNWRNGRCRIQVFKGHMDGVLSLRYNHRLLFTGSYDSTVAIWDTKSGNLIRRLTGHTDGVKGIYFDDQKMITASLDKTIRVWNYITGSCISTYRGHQDSVLSVDSYKKIIVSGSADKTVKVWHVESRTCYTLRGHTEWVNCVKLHPKSFTCYSCSDDKTLRMWDIRTNSCIKVFRGHVGQVQKVIPLTIKDVANLVVDKDLPEERHNAEQDPQTLGNQQNQNQENEQDDCTGVLDPNLKYPTHLLSCSLDNTIKLWEVRTGKCVRTQFGHVEGVWDIAADNFRIVSGSHDKNVKIWDLQNGKCIQTFTGHKAPIVCVGIGDSSFASGDELGEVKMWHFDDI